MKPKSKNLKLKKHWTAKCVTKRCRGIVHRSEHSNKCSRCRRDWHREYHPLAYYWGKLKRRARERGLSFSLTLAEYTRFAIGTDYMSMKGKTSLSLSCDRIENGLGYHFWNLKAMTLQENSRKQFVPYFNNGCPPDRISEYHELERSYRGKMEKIAAKLGPALGFGSKVFWHEFRRQKNELLQLEEA